MSASFDFKEYLASTYPGEEFEICVLAGGLVNFTVRARRISDARRTGSHATLRDKSSFILKHAPGYIATIGESAPFTQFRQVCSVSGRYLIIDH